MKRKINLVGRNTLTVSLPSKWAKEQGLKKGDELEVQVTENQLCISKDTPPENPLKEIEINLAEDEKTSVRSLLGAYYQKGFDLIRINFADPKIFKSIKEAASQLIGFEIIDRSETGCTIKSYLKETPEEISVILSKMINTIKTLQKMTREDYVAGKYEHLEEAEEYRFACWKLRDLSIRLISKNNLLEGKKHEYRLIIWTLEKINRNYKRLYRILKEIGLKKNNAVLAYYDEVTSLFDFYAKAMLKKDLKNFEHIHKEHDRLVCKAFEILPGLRKDCLIMTYLLENVRRMQDLVSPSVMVNH